MFDRRSWMMGVGCALALLAPSRVVGADGDQMFATVATPAIVTVKARAAIERRGSLRVVIVVTGFEPPRDGTVVEVVVKAQEEGTDTEREIGRLGIFPYTEFKVANPASGRRLTLPLPREFTGRPVKLTVQLVPLRGGEGQGARLDLGGAEFA
jgi:hypothetical protein